MFGKKKEIETETETELAFKLKKLDELLERKEITIGEYMQIGLLVKLVSMVEKALS